MIEVAFIIETDDIPSPPMTEENGRRKMGATTETSPSRLETEGDDDEEEEITPVTPPLTHMKKLLAAVVDDGGVSSTSSSGTPCTSSFSW
nr:hypothetical protein [Tanacetum cinerariifolium]